MQEKVVANRIRWGILALVISGLLAIPATFLGGGQTDPAIDPGGFAEQITSARFAPSTLVFMVTNILSLFGVFALYAYLVGSRAERWMFASLILSTVAIVSTTFSLGQLSVISLAGELYLQGQQAYLDELINAPIGWADILLIIATRVLGLASIILLSIAVWRSGGLPRGQLFSSSLRPCSSRSPL